MAHVVGLQPLREVLGLGHSTCRAAVDDGVLATPCSALENLWQRSRNPGGIVGKQLLTRRPSRIGSSAKNCWPTLHLRSQHIVAVSG